MTSVISEFLENILAIFFKPFHGPDQVTIFDKTDYHPVFGLPGKVDEPKIMTNTYFPQPYHKDTRLINGDWNTHITNTKEYALAYLTRKHLATQNYNRTYQLDSHHMRPRKGKTLHFIDNAMSVYSYDHHSERQPKRTSFFDFVNASKNRGY